MISAAEAADFSVEQFARANPIWGAQNGFIKLVDCDSGQTVDLKKLSDAGVTVAVSLTNLGVDGTVVAGKLNGPANIDAIGQGDFMLAQVPWILLEPPPTAVPIPPELLRQAIDLNNGRFRVKLPDGRAVDLDGQGHTVKPNGPIIDTPHTHYPQPPFDAPYQNLPRGPNPIPRSSTLQDINDVLDYLKGTIKDIVFPNPPPPVNQRLPIV
jgi:hypothetical protein